MADPDRGRRLGGTALIFLAAVIAVLGVAGGFLTGYPMMESAPTLFGLFFVCGIPAAIGAYLLKGATSGPPTEPGEIAPMSAVRIIFAIFGALIMLFSGGCALVFIPEAMRTNGSYIDLPTIAVLSGLPFLGGLLIWLLAAKAGRRARVPPL